MILHSSSIVILGMHQETLDAFDPGWHLLQNHEIWGMAHHDAALDFATKAFEAHSPEIAQKWGGDKYIERLDSIASMMPLTTMYDYEHLVPAATWWPASDRIESSLAYMISRAYFARRMSFMNSHLSEIFLYGINLDAEDGEYAYQRPNMAYWIGKCEGTGIAVHLPEGCSLFKSNWTGGVYGHPDNINDIEYKLL